MLRFPTLAGTYAEYVTAPADEIARKPSSLSHSEAAAVPMVSLTAWQALFDAPDVSDGDRVLVHAAAGGVGHMGYSSRTNTMHTSLERHPEVMKRISGKLWRR